MPLQINNETYNGLNSLYSNAGSWVTGTVEFSNRFSLGSGTSNTITYNAQGSQYWLEIQQGDWGIDGGFAQGDSIDINWTWLLPPVPFQPQSQTLNVTYVAGNLLYLDAPLTQTSSSGTGAVPDGSVFPTNAQRSGILVVADKAPNAVEWEFNLTPNGGQSLNSVIDQELNRFQLQDVDTLSIGVPTAMNQLGNKSGGYLTDVELTYDADAGNGWRDYTITYKIFNWGVIKDGFLVPNYYDQADCLAPVHKCRGFAQFGNPNGILEDISVNTEANTGYFNENYNGQPNNYGLQTIQWLDSLGNSISAPDYSGNSTFTAVLDAPFQVNPTSTYRMGIAWLPEDGTQYQNLADPLVNNLLVCAPEVDFIADGSVDATVYSGFTRSDGSQWDLTNLSFTITGVNELTITGELQPNNNAGTLFATVPDGGRRTALWVRIANVSLTGFNSDEVNLLLWDADNIDAPTIGVQIPDVLDETLLDHSGLDITSTLPTMQTTTEDDVRYISNFLLEEGKLYSGIRCGLYAYNTVTEEEFKLEEQFFSFTNVPFVNNQFQVNESVSRNFNLPPTTDRKSITLTRVPANDIPGKYGVKIDYGYLSDWRYWIEASNVDNDFFDLNEPNNGLNRDWQRFSNSGNWIVRLCYFTRFNGVDDFNHFEVGIRPYEDETVTTTKAITVLSNGQTPNDLLADELCQVTYTLTWTNVYVNPWATVAIEDFQSGNRWLISSVLPQGNVQANPLKPIVGAVGLDLQTASNVAQLTFVVDCSLITVDKVSMTPRIYSEDGGRPVCGDGMAYENGDCILLENGNNLLIE